MANASACHGAAKTGPALFCGKPGRISASRGFNVGLPQIEIDDCVVVLSPEFGGGESDGIEPLGIFTPAMGIAIGKNESAMNANDLAGATADITGQACVALDMNVARPHVLAEAEAGGGGRSSCVGCA